MGPPYEREPANNFPGSAWLEPGVPHPCEFRSVEMMGNDAKDYSLLTAGCHIYVMGWVQYVDGMNLARRAAFCRLYGVAINERHPRFHIVEDPDYEHED
jgi:hypothetical protein